jgi:hypothetical protein
MSEDIPTAFRAVFVQVLQNIMLKEFSLRDFGVKDFLDSSDSDEETAAAPSIVLAPPTPDIIWNKRRLLKFILLMSLNEFWVDAMISHSYIANSCYINDDNVGGFYAQCEQIVSGETEISRFRQNCTRSILSIVLEMRAIYKSGPIQAARGDEVDHRIQSIQIIEDCTKIIKNLSMAMNRKHRKGLLTFVEAGKIAVNRGDNPTSLIGTFVKTTTNPSRAYWLSHISSFLSQL